MNNSNLIKIAAKGYWSKSEQKLEASYTNIFIIEN